MVAALKGKITGFFINGHERTLIAKKNIALSFLVRGGGILIGLILVPMTIDYVSPTQYGIWLTISSILGWLNFFDVGLGNGLKNTLTKSFALGEMNKAREYVSTTYVALVIISTISFVIFSIANNYINWNSTLNVNTENEETLKLVMWVAVSCFCIQFVAQLINTILTATHQSGNSSIITFIGQVLTLIVIFYCTKLKSGDLLTLVTIVASMPVISLIISSWVLYKNKLKNLSPSWRLVKIKYIYNLLNTGGKFFLIQIGALILFQTSYIIISQILGPESVTIYSVCYKLFSVMIMIFTIIMTPLWSSFTDAYSKSDFNWLKNSVDKMRKLWIVFSIFTLMILFMSDYLFKYWIGNNIKVPLSLSICMAIYVIAYMWQMLHVYLLNGIGKIRLQLIAVTASAIVNIPISIIMGRNFGLPGIVATNTILFILMGTIFSVQCEKIIKQNAYNIWDK
ncbi:lipopolysaccharide biosynthesis protein [Spirosoma radiotolerans]|uniref:Polysaccharide biosynthesis protein n=1 Tax=Spirosoma radiotolerans TaxID=1379870 RepID=A0A0E3ZYW0_9BACT|nr:oligosaccharide flippase family protein [Spirosoma radiotolerans]AKD57058.1 hypothetical protein SD10_21350 [Spirosoma radiotolerans]